MLVESALSDTVSVDGIELDYGEVFGRFNASAYGLHQETQPLRFAADFGYGIRQQMLQDCGPDLHPVEHMEVTHRDLSLLLARYVCIDLDGGQTDLSPQDIIVGRFTAIVHDVGECTHDEISQACGGVVGDIPHGRKTPASRELEMRIVQHVLAKTYPELPDWFLQRTQDLIGHREQSFIHQLYELSHDFGVYSTGLTAGRLALGLIDTEPDTQRTMQLSRLAKEVTCRARSAIEGQLDDFPSTRPSLEASERLYQKIQVSL